MKTLAILAVMVLAAGIGSGCTAMAVAHHNGRVVDGAMLRARALNDGRVGAQVGVEVYSVKGLTGLFAEQPALGVAALGADILAVVAGIAIYNDLQNDKEDVVTEERPTTEQNSGGDSVVVYGDGNEINIDRASGVE